MEKLHEKDRSEILNYISDEPEFNLFILGDLENFGVDTEHVEFFAETGKDGYDFLIMRFRDSFVLYSRTEEFHADTAANFLIERNAQFINGKGNILEKIVAYFPGMNVKRSYLSKLTTVENAFDFPSKYSMRMLSEKDAETEVDLFLKIDEFRDSYIGREKEQIENIKVNLTSSGAGFGAFDGEQLIGAASTAAANSISAMVIGVATHPDYRKLGIASALVAGLCNDCLSRGMKFLCLFYDNPQAGSIYRKIGFREMGGYILMTPKH